MATLSTEDDSKNVRNGSTGDVVTPTGAVPEALRPGSGQALRPSSGQAETTACCGPAKLDVCCEPEEKSACCEPTSNAGSGCGCV